MEWERERHTGKKVLSVCSSDEGAGRLSSMAEYVLACPVVLEARRPHNRGSPDLNTITGVDIASDVPGSYELQQNYPNPFNPSTVITYAIPQNAHVRIDVFNVLGQKVALLFDQEQTVGTHSIAWNARNEGGSMVGSGVYFVKMQAGAFSQVKKMMLAK